MTAYALLPANARGTVLRNLALKALSLGLERGCRLVVTVASAPILGEAAFGRFVFAATVTAILALAADLGLGLWTTRSLARAEAPAAQVVRVGLSLRALSTVPYLLAVAVAALLSADVETRAVLVVLGASALFNSFADHLGAILRGEERFADEARLNATRAVLVVVLGFGALFTHRGLVGLSVALAAAGLGACGYGAFALVRRHAIWTSAGPHSMSDRLLRRLALRQALPIWIAGLLSLLYFKVDTFFVRAFAGDAELGAYGVAYKVFEGAMLLPAVILAVTFPRLVRAFADPPAHRRLERRLAAALLALGTCVGALCFFARDPLIVLVFGRAFVRSVDSLAVLSLGIPLVFLNFGLTHFLIARHLERVNTWLALMMLAVTVTLDSVLVPHGSGPGAALATVLAEVALTLGCLLALRAPPRAPAASSTARTSG